MDPIAAAEPPRRSTRARPTDEQLLDAALAVFAEHGFAATTMSAVAEGCDSTKPTLYAHFGDKEALHVRVLEREAAACRAVLLEAYEAHAGSDLTEQVTGDTRALFDFASARPDGFALLFGGDLTVVAVRVRESLLAEVEGQLAGRVHDYLCARGAVAPGRGPSQAECQVAAMLAGVALSAARHALRDDAPLEVACELATAFSLAALTSLDPST